MIEFMEHGKLVTLSGEDAKRLYEARLTSAGWTHDGKCWRKSVTRDVIEQMAKESTRSQRETRAFCLRYGMIAPERAARWIRRLWHRTTRRIWKGNE